MSEGLRANLSSEAKTQIVCPDRKELSSPGTKEAKKANSAHTEGLETM